jgi:hypothetical protein
MGLQVKIPSGAPDVTIRRRPWQARPYPMDKVVNNGGFLVPAGVLGRYTIPLRVSVGENPAETPIHKTRGNNAGNRGNMVQAGGIFYAGNGRQYEAGFAGPNSTSYEPQEVFPHIPILK